jgi:hypothetical protein
MTVFKGHKKKEGRMWDFSSRGHYGKKCIFIKSICDQELFTNPF